MYLATYIKVYDAYLPTDFLSSLIQRYDAKMVSAEVGEGRVDIPSRNCLVHGIDDAGLSQHVYNVVDDVIHKYTRDFPVVQVSKNDGGYNFLKYLPGSYYRQHVDSGTVIHRTLSIIILLNDAFEGGEISFFDGQYRVPVKANQVVVFPSNFLFPHQVETITSGIRYSIATWVY